MAKKQIKKVKVWESAEEITLPKYRFEVGAVKIKEIKNIGSESDPLSAGNGSKIINNSFTVPFHFVQEFKPEVGDYITVGESGELGCFSGDYFESNFNKIK